MPIITADKIRNAIPILFKKGISGNQNLNAMDSGMVSNAVVKAAADVALFQNIPKKNIANTPGVIKLEYSCINW